MRKRKEKTVDIRPWLLSAQLLEEPRTDLRLPKSNDRVQVVFKLELPPSGGARADEIVSALGLPDTDPWIVRTQVIVEESP